MLFIAGLYMLCYDHLDTHCEMIAIWRHVFHFGCSVTLLETSLIPEIKVKLNSVSCSLTNSENISVFFSVPCTCEIKY